MQPLLPSDPTHIGRYELRGRLGSGGMGTVYLGYSPGGRLAAVKVISPQVLAQPDTLARFRREAETLRTVRSAYTAALIDCELTAPPYWMATEFIPGPTLADVLDKDGPMPADRCMLLTASLAEGLSDIHAHGICHRDLKPQNIILSATGPHLIDFGLARDPADTGLTQADIIVGTLGYIAPELLTSDDGLTPATDVFALGVTIAHAATGRRPYGTGRAESVAFRILHENIDLDGVDPDLEQLIRSCVSSDPAQRPRPAEIIELCRRNRRQQLTPAQDPPSWSGATATADPDPVRTAPSWPAAGGAQSWPPAGARGGADARDTEPPAGARPGRARKRLLLVVGAVAAAIVLVGGGAFAALRLRPVGEPDPVVPAAQASLWASPSPSATAPASPKPSKTPSSRAPAPTTAAPSKKPVTPSATKAAPGVTTVTSADGRCIQMPQTDANGAQVKAAKCNGSAGQRWKFTRQGAIMLATADRCLDIGGNAGADINYRIQIWNCSFNEAQVWVPQTDGSLYNARSGRCLSILPGDDGGPALAILACTATASQRWKLPTATASPN